MPARTFPAVPPGSSSSYRPSSHSFASPSQPVPHSDLHDERLQGTYVLYDMTIPSPPMAPLDTTHNPFPARDHRYPTAFIPPPLQVHHHPAQPLRPGPTFVSYPASGPALLHANSHYGASIPPTAWHPLPPPPLFRPPTLTPPPPIPHKVWILDCKSCSTFLTNRGMKAVLLLRPNVPLYSTDAMPINCSAFSDSADSLTSPPSSAVFQSSGHSLTDGERLRTLARTCECLTQTLLCHVCGSGVGYMIVSPCHRCMSSITATNRSTNGHRFVFYSSEIVANERHYISGESGVRPFIPSLPSPLPMPTHSIPPGLGVNYLPMHRTVSHPLENPPRLTAQEVTPESSRSSASAVGPHSPMSPIEFARASSASSQPSPHSDHVPSLSGVSPRAPPPSHSASPQIENGDYASSPSDVLPSPRWSSVSSEPYPETLRSGDIVYWHHLVRSGEIPAVVEDPRARGSSTSQDDRNLVGELEDKVPRPHKTRTRTVFAGR